MAERKQGIDLQSAAQITVLFSTRNGSKVVGRTLEGYAQQQSPGVAWRVVAVDNGSTDETPSVLSAFTDRLPLTILQQPVPGKNRALNLAVASLVTGLLILTDDDAIPAPDFIASWSKVLNAQLDYALFGGRIDPLFDEAPPRWLTPKALPFDVLYAARDLQDGAVEADQIFGPNMAIRGNLFEQGLRFNESIGPNGSDALYPMGSETELCMRLARAGVRSWFLRAPSVSHIVRPNQMTLEYVAARARRSGRGDAKRLIALGDLQGNRKMTRLMAMRRQVGEGVRGLQRFMPPSALKLRLLWDMNWSRGYYGEIYSS